MSEPAVVEVVTRNPATGEELRRYAAHDAAGVDALLAQADAAARIWRDAPLPDRTALLRAVGKLLTERREEYAALVTAEMGKPLAEARAEIDKCAWNCEVVADRAPEWLADHALDSSASRALPVARPPSLQSRAWVSYEPLGVVFAVMPWNFPFWQVLRFACAALAAGNAAVLKHSPDTTGCALAIERLVADAGAPPGLFRALVLTAEQVPATTAAVVADPRVAAVTLTGSERAGSAVAAAAGAALKKTVLELGRVSEVPRLLRGAGRGTPRRRRRTHSRKPGLSVLRRLAGHPTGHRAGKRRLRRHALGGSDPFVVLEVGDPTAPGTTVGPMARADLRDALLRQVAATVAQGARLVTGGRALDGPGWYVEPTVLDGVRPGMTAFAEETFGPVAAVVRARDDDHAVELANDTDFGLGASVWGEPEHALAVGRRVRSGALFVNTVVASDPRLPFGGVGRSGYGRELSAEGVREFTNVRTMVVA